MSETYSVAGWLYSQGVGHVVADGSGAYPVGPADWPGPVVGVECHGPRPPADIEWSADLTVRFHDPRGGVYELMPDGRWLGSWGREWHE